MQSELLSRSDVEESYGLPKRWLEKAAVRGDGPPMIRISPRMVRYVREDLEKWLSARRVYNTAQHPSFDDLASS